MGLYWYMAKKIKTVWDRVNDYSKKQQSGLNDVDSFNRNVEESITELVSYLFSIYNVNERASELLQPYIKSEEITGNSTGVFSKPTDFNYYISSSYQGNPVHKVSLNQLDDYEQIPQRRGDLTKKRVNIAGVNDKWQARPKSEFQITLNFVFTPSEKPKIVFTETNSDDEDILVYNDTSTIDFLFDEKCVPIITYMVLEKFGISVREQILMEYARLGIAKENPIK